ncbi:MAG: amidase [Desulfobacteraceae bacterium]|nr:amidase [Desulfobacteraceae bacterium]
MGGFAEYEDYDALGLAELVRDKKVTPQELCEAALHRIDRANPILNAVVCRMDAEARRRAVTPADGPFTGVPFLLKDLNFADRGIPMTNGCKALRSYRPDYEDEMVVRFKRAGLVIVGRTNTPEFGLMAVTEPELFGPCRNPWNPAYSPGGSSGGSAAAVAAGVVPMASAGDGGGSIRIPSSYCGLFGLKPSHGRNPNGPGHARNWQGAVQAHVISRSVRDSAAALDATCGPDTGAPYEIRPPVRPYRQEVGADPGRLKIAFNTRSPVGTPVHPECVKAVEDAARLLDGMGHYVQEALPDVDGRALAKSYVTMYFGEVATDIRELQRRIGRRARRRDVEAVTWLLGLLGRTLTAADFVAAMRRWDLEARNMGRFFEDYDLYLTPTTAHPHTAIGELAPRGIEALMIRTVNTLGLGGLLKRSGMVDRMAERSLERVPFTQLANLCGLPAMSVQLHWTDTGMPCGVQFIGPFGTEDRLFRLAAQLEAARPWFARRPPLLRNDIRPELRAQK